MHTISQIEDAMISTITALGLFRHVGSIGRKAKPVSLAYPSAFVYFVGDTDTGTRPRPIFETQFEVAVYQSNKGGEAAAAKDTYGLIDSIRDAINGKNLSLDDIDLFYCSGREMIGYEDGIISYAVKFNTRHFLPLPTP